MTDPHESPPISRSPDATTADATTAGTTPEPADSAVRSDDAVADDVALAPPFGTAADSANSDGSAGRAGANDVENGSSDALEDDPPTDPGDDSGDDPEGESESAKKRSFWKELPVLVVVALLLAFLIKTFLVQAFYIPSESMENTLLIGDRVLVNKLAYRLGDVERGDIIVFDGKNSFDANKPKPKDTSNPVARAFRAVASSFGLAPGTESDYIKRVIGIGGDHVTCCNDDGNIEVNGVPLAPEDYLFPGDKPSNMPFDVTVPADHVWVMGDHRARSEDSRAHGGSPGGGSVPVGDVVGRAFVIVWPVDRWDTLTRPGDFADIPDDPVSDRAQ